MFYSQYFRYEQITGNNSVNDQVFDKMIAVRSLKSLNSFLIIAVISLSTSLAFSSEDQNSFILRPETENSREALIVIQQEARSQEAFTNMLQGLSVLQSEKANVVIAIPESYWTRGLRAQYRREFKQSEHYSRKI
ncbi:MAG: hypothetical protein HRT44_14170, partial [Bdellovibrionales bacterium]|nr:hypothetical protein [Bdellovibrionales bacterium]NQZ20384.1 hypothetical protein [Bdellovibrionales bacterium]